MSKDVQMPVKPASNNAEAYSRHIVQHAAIGVGVFDTPEALDAFCKPGVAAAIWRRQPLQSFQNWIDSLPSGYLPSARITIRPETVCKAITNICLQANMPGGPERARFVEDVAALSHIFARIMNTEFVRVRLDVVNDNACEKFHIDRVTARLICTYRGPGTQYGISTDGAEPKRVFSVPTGAPMILRGTLWPELPASGLLHRSPPIEDTEQIRLVLVIDPVFEADAHTIN